MNTKQSSILESLRSRGWSLETFVEKQLLPDHLLQRYKWAERSLQNLAGFIRLGASADDKTWLLTVDDYSGYAESAFAWNEWEKLSLQAAEEDGNSAWKTGIKAFWDDHLPIALSVEDGYRYWAVKSDGTVVEGCDPEFEATSFFAKDYTDFLRKIANHRG